jgi:hypothetical protein
MSGDIDKANKLGQEARGRGWDKQAAQELDEWLRRHDNQQSGQGE